MVVGLALSSIVSGFAESGMLIVLAQIAATIVNKSKHAPFSVAGLHIHASVGTLFQIALAFALVRLILQAGPMSLLPARIAADIQARLRVNLFHSFTRASWEVQSRDREGHLQEIMTSQVLQATQGAQQATTLLTASATFLILMLSAIELNARAAGLVLVAALLLFAAMRPLNRLGVRRARQLSRAQLAYAGGISETVRVAEETQVFGVGGAQRDRIDQFIVRARDLFLRTQVVSRLTPNLYQSIMYLMLIGGLAALYTVNRHNVASLGGVILLLVRAGTNGQQIQAAYQGLRQSLPFLERLQDAVARYSASTAATGANRLESVSEMAFEEVSFAYRPEQPVLSSVSFEVSGGEAIGVIGPSGAGKSTLVQILLQLRRPVTGRYLVNGLPAEEFASADWHRKVAYVPQEPRLVHATVAENIRYFREGIDDEAMERAARNARIHDDIVGWSDGYDTIVGPRADAVSGGQQQRICLARALAAGPEVLILDEPTSALDPQSEALIQESLLTLRSELTLFIVAHRMSTLDVCDRVMVISDGRLTAFDTIEALQRDSAYYRMATTLTGDRGTPGNGSPISPPPSGGGAVGGGSPGPSPPAAGEGPRNGSPRHSQRVAGAVSAPLPLAGRVPDFYIAGHPKSGTTALYEMLRRHPQIFMSEEKEPWYFSQELAERAPPRKPFALPDSFEHYTSLFAGARPDQIAGEASTTYLWSRGAASLIAEANPDARVIAILREPASFLHSLHLQFVETYIETETDFARALALEGERRRGSHIAKYSYWPQMLQYAEHVSYVQQLARYHAVLPHEQVLTLIYDDFRRDNEATVRQVLRFLDVDDTVAVAAVEANASVMPRSQRLHHAVHAVSVGRGPISRAAKTTLQTLTPQKWRRNVLHTVRSRVVYAQPSPPDEALMLALRRRFRPEVVALSEYLDRDLVELWGYDRLD
jgi:ATP-binding cassette subfamily B protein